MDRKYISLECNVVFVLDNDGHFVHVTLRTGISDYGGILAYCTNSSEFVSNGFDRAGDIFVQNGVTRLIYRRIIFLAPYEEFCGVYVAHIQDGMCRDLDCENTIVLVHRVNEIV